jgi:hypothetical protein
VRRWLVLFLRALLLQPIRRLHGLDGVSDIRREEAEFAEREAMKLRRFNLLDAAILVGLGLFEDARRIWRERRT